MSTVEWASVKDYLSVFAAFWLAVGDALVKEISHEHMGAEPYRTCGTDSRSLMYFFSMLTKELATAERFAPRFIEPMYAQLVHELPDGGQWTYEVKLDGYRCLAAECRSRCAKPGFPRLVKK